MKQNDTINANNNSGFKLVSNNYKIEYDKLR